MNAIKKVVCCVRKITNAKFAIKVITRKEIFVSNAKRIAWSVIKISALSANKVLF